MEKYKSLSIVNSWKQDMQKTDATKKIVWKVNVYRKWNEGDSTPQKV